MPGTPGEGCGQERRWHSCSKALQPRSRWQGLEEPGIHWLHGAGSDWLRSGFAGKCHLLGEFGWPLSQPVPRQGRDAGTRRCQGRDAGTRPCHIGDTRPRLSPSAARRQRGWARGGFWNSLGNGKSGISQQSGKAGVSLPAASHHTTHRRARETRKFNSPQHAAN